MKSKHRKPIPKTRGHKVERKPYVPIRKLTNAQQHGERKASDEDQHGEDQKRQGNQGSDDQRKWEDTKKQAPLESIGNQEDTKESVHPGTLQEMQQLPEQYAFHETSDKTEIESEELPPWL